MQTTGQDRVKRCAGVSSSESTSKGSHGCERGSRIFSPSTHTHSRQHNLYSTAGQQCCVSGQTSGRLEEKRAAIIVHSLPFRRSQGLQQFGNMRVLETTTTDKLGEQHNTWRYRRFLDTTLDFPGHFNQISGERNSLENPQRGILLCRFLLFHPHTESWDMATKPNRANEIVTTGSRLREGQVLSFSNEKMKHYWTF